MSLLLALIAKFVWHLPVPWWLWTVSVLQTLYVWFKAFASAKSEPEVARAA